jgi:hypothetical protein
VITGPSGYHSGERSVHVSLRGRVGLTLAGMAIGLTAAAADGGRVSGTLVVNGTSVPVQHITAVTYDTPSPGRLISVLVSDKPADPRTFQEYTRIGPGERVVAGLVTGAWVTMHAEDKAFSGFSFTLDAQNRVILDDVLAGKGRDDNFSILDDYLVVEVTSTTPRLVGRIRTKEPMMEINTEKVGIDLTFDVPVADLGK